MRRDRPPAGLSPGQGEAPEHGPGDTPRDTPEHGPKGEPERIPTKPAGRHLTEPHPDRLPLAHPGRDGILAAHAEALAASQPGYVDPTTGLFVLTAAYLRDRGTCCGQGCRHCPYAS